MIIKCIQHDKVIKIITKLIIKNKTSNSDIEVINVIL